MFHRYDTHLLYSFYLKQNKIKQDLKKERKKTPQQQTKENVNV